MTSAGRAEDFLDIDSKEAGDILAGTAGSLSSLFVEAFRQSVAELQKPAIGRNVRRYCADILTKGCFEVVSPLTGEIVQSGTSLVLTDKTVVFSFPEAPTLFIGSGDLGRGYPLCAAIVLEPPVWIELERTDWGFGRRHLEEFFALVERLAWRPSTPNEPLLIVTGDSNFAHHAWNQLSPFHDLANAGWRLGDFALVATHLPLGPLHTFFPEIELARPVHTSDSRLSECNRLGQTCITLGGERLQIGLTKRILEADPPLYTSRTWHIKENISGERGPVLWMSVRTRNRTLTNQVDVLVSIGEAFLSLAPNGSVVIDGHSISGDQEAEGHEAAASIVALDLQVADVIAERLRKGGAKARHRIYLAVGLPIIDSIWLSQSASIYFTHHGTVQHKIGWFNATPGMIHCNLEILATSPATWVAAQSEIAICPQYIAAHLVTDAAEGPTDPFGELLKTNNYTITNIEELTRTFANFTLEHMPPQTKLAKSTLFYNLTKLISRGRRSLQRWKA